MTEELNLKKPWLLATLSALVIAVLILGMPGTVTTSAQGPTPTPAIIIVTATPAGGGVAQPTAPGQVATEAPPPGATQAPREWQAFNAARAYLSRKINKNLRYVNSWTWDLLVFPDSTLGCPAPQGETSVKGDTAGINSPFNRSAIPASTISASPMTSLRSSTVASLARMLVVLQPAHLSQAQQPAHLNWVVIF